MVALNHAKGRLKPHQNGAHMTMPARVKTTPVERGTMRSTPPIVSTRQSAEECQEHRDGHGHAMGFELPVAVGREPKCVPDGVLVSEVPGGRNSKGPEAHTVDQSAQAGET